ncbi:MAG: class I SAM-dependent methyltransferase [Ferruginibacter sp.]
MADKNEIDFIYTTLDKIFRLSIGEKADFSAAFYNGDFSMSLEAAQKAKHKFIADQLFIKAGSRVIELGSGWGPFLNYLKEEKNVTGIGLTLSDGQYRACKKNGFEVYVKDCRTVKPSDFGSFDAVVSVGAFEHFCSLEDYKNGNQEKVYNDFFAHVANLLPTGGRFFLQTMTFGKNMLPAEVMNLNAPKNSDEYLLALSAKHLPGSWLPYDSAMLTRTAAPWFKQINISCGRLDYIETIMQWRKMLRKFNLKKYALYLSLIIPLLKEKKLSHLWQVFRISPLMVCFQRELMDHYRIVFEKV